MKSARSTSYRERLIAISSNVENPRLAAIDQIDCFVVRRASMIVTSVSVASLGVDAVDLQCRVLD